ncbi:hypothetical protein T4B_4785 [Trichinella pseudospiralis]|uniref:Uncharacterized protein n=1 Tax=Trichinella pseudospiralis TaxID=6337 RepID=A0A0V1GGZ7_TRIPS|nr:hypothetical protein T4B_10365 [Trichinella pseudospiralis]KRY97982.1 hypothetical protein T4B_4785 [Trichinella pseudospiralis]
MPCLDEFRVHLRKEKWVTCSSSTGYAARATLTVSNDESPYFQSSPLPHPVAVPEACRLARSPQ